MTTMLRAALAKSEDVDGHGFRIRSREVSRLEGLSDAVFGFAITLLVVSLEVPNTYDELVAMMRGFVAFGASFAASVVRGAGAHDDLFAQHHRRVRSSGSCTGMRTGSVSDSASMRSKCS